MIGERIMELRKSLGLSRPKFGQRLGVSRDVIANYENDKVTPKEVFLDHLCDVYHVHKEWLYNGEGPVFQKGYGDMPAQEAWELFNALTPDLRDLALEHIKSLHKLMERRPLTFADEVQEMDTIRLTASLLDADSFDEVKGLVSGKTDIGKYITGHMDSQNVSAAELADRSTIDAAVLDEILSSAKKPSREQIIAICCGLGLDVDETKRMLAATGVPALYAKNRRDYACMYALMKSMGVRKLNQLLKELDEPLLMQ